MTKTSQMILVMTLMLNLAGMTAEAATKPFFPAATKAVIMVQSPIIPGPNGPGIIDPDAEKLYNEMNVPAEPSFIGPGKKIEADNKGLQMVCGLREGQGYACTIVIGDTPHARISPSRQQVEFVLEGTQADELRALFVPGDDGNYQYYSGDDRMEIQAKPGRFRLAYK